jgi:hypothetical protein
MSVKTINVEWEYKDKLPEIDEKTLGNMSMLSILEMGKRLYPYVDINGERYYLTGKKPYKIDVKLRRHGILVHKETGELITIDGLSPDKNSSMSVYNYRIGWIDNEELIKNYRHENGAAIGQLKEEK